MRMQFYKQFYGAGEGQIVISGQFDPEQMKKLVTELFGDWKSREPLRSAFPITMYRVPGHQSTKLKHQTSRTRFSYRAMPMKMSDDDPDYAALTIAGMVFGGSPNSRLFQRIRVKDGLSYGAVRRILDACKG